MGGGMGRGMNRMDRNWQNVGRGDVPNWDIDRNSIRMFSLLSASNTSPTSTAGAATVGLPTFGAVNSTSLSVATAYDHQG